uniref:Cytochrome c oxidase subunit 2 n=1 Tax=Nemoptera coa TaxID=560912 RepID=A0A1S5QYD3_9NEOP|nr:cytochrome c oxidase subunit II [Nemoptera coa]WRK67314.1 cytochrome c oxidase subunit 2 [Nemoptera coa]
MATWSDIWLLDSASPLMEQLTFFHDSALFILAIITGMVSYLMYILLKNKTTDRFVIDGQLIEIVWTLMPAMTLIFIALPSLKLLYMLDEIESPTMTLKTIGHQWYWSYEYSDFFDVEFDAYMIPTNQLNLNGFRLIDVDNRTTLPLMTQIRVLISAADVIHSWTVPATGVKADASPGRLNQGNFLINRLGLFFGQCSEICGANHSFMPIVLELIPMYNFISWIKEKF